MSKSSVSSQPKTKDEKLLKSAAQVDQIWTWTGMLSDTIAGFTLWTLVCYFPFMVFWVPMVKMAYSGWEVFVLAYGTPILLSSAFLRRFVASNLWLIRILSIIGISSFYLNKQDHNYKLCLMGFGLGFSILDFFGCWTGSIQARRHRATFGFLTGFVVQLILRIGYLSFPATFMNQYANYANIAAIVLASLFIIPERNLYVSAEKVANPQVGNWSSALAVYTGIVFFMSYFSEHGVLSRFTGLPPFPHGVLVALALTFGIVISLTGLASTFVWLGVALVGATLFIVGQNEVFPPYVEFAGGVILAVYATSIWFDMVERLSQNFKLGRTLFVGFLLFFGLILWGLAAVAYKFMEGGWIVRERSKSLLFAHILLMAWSHVRSFSILKRRDYIPTKAIAFLVLIVAATLTPVTVMRSEKKAEIETPKNINALVWAIHFGYDNWGMPSAPAAAQILKTNQVNLVGLVETDTVRLVMGNHDVVEYLAEELQFHSSYGPSAAQNTWGCALLSRFPIEKEENIILPSPEGELACLLSAYVRVNDTLVNVLVTHFGNTEDELDRRLQTESLANIIRQKKAESIPIILLGYLTADPYSKHWVEIITAGLRDTTDSMDRYCLYVLYDGLKLQNFVRIDKGDVSDTESQLAVFSLPSKIPSEIKPPCSTFSFNSVTCQAQDHCGWCQLGTGIPAGTCLDLEYQKACLSFPAGVWIGTNSSSEEQRTLLDLLEKVEENQSQGPYAVRKDSSGSSIVWNLGNFHSIDRTHDMVSSPVFELKGSFWRILLSMKRKNTARRNRSFGLFLEKVDLPVGNREVEAQFRLSAGGSAETNRISNTFRHKYKPADLTLGWNHFTNMEQIYSFVESNSLRLSLEILD